MEENEDFITEELRKFGKTDLGDIFLNYLSQKNKNKT
jgi:hypothetical protein